ncbi:MAG: hypothetical protein WCG20_02015 [bacterium]
MKIEFWFRFANLLNRRKVIFYKGKIEVIVSWEGGEEFDTSSRYEHSKNILLESIPNAHFQNGRIVVATLLELLPTSQETAEAVAKELGWDIAPLADYEQALVEKNNI